MELFDAFVSQEKWHSQDCILSQTMNVFINTLLLIFSVSLRLSPGGSLGNSAAASACHVFCAIKLFYYILHCTVFHAKALAVLTTDSHNVFYCV